MKKNERWTTFTHIVEVGFGYPLITTFVTLTTIIGCEVFREATPELLVITAFALTVLTAVWGVVFLVVLSINLITERVAEKRELADELTGE